MKITIYFHNGISGPQSTIASGEVTMSSVDAAESYMAAVKSRGFTTLTEPNGNVILIPFHSIITVRVESSAYTGKTQRLE